MFMRIAISVFLLLILLRFPQLKSLSQIITSRYGDTSKDYENFKSSLDLETLVICDDNNMSRRFLNFLFS